jgi:hypothetical protein
MGLASRGLRDMGNGSTEIGDPLELAAVNRQAEVIRRRALVAATVASAVLLLLP